MDEPRIGDRVMVIDGTFLDFVGTVTDTRPEARKVLITIVFNGRRTPMELNYDQVRLTLRR